MATQRGDLGPRKAAVLRAVIEEYIRTGERGHKFGIPLADALPAARLAAALPNTTLIGLDMHLGSMIAEIAPYREVSQDEGPRRDTTGEKMAALRPLREGGLVTAALSSQISDGAAALLIASDDAVRRYGLRPRARITHLSARGDDPVLMLTAPIAATAHALKSTGLTLDDIDLVEINEAFASVVLAWQRETGADLARVNVSGGAIALGHPLGATGARLLTTLVHGLIRTGHAVTSTSSS